MRKALALTLVLAGWTGGASATPAGHGFRVIVASGHGVSDIKRDELARIFLKKQTRWKDGQEVAPVDQSARSAVRAAFSRDVLAAEGLDKISAVENYWRQQIYSGRGNPPAVKTSDADVLQYVAATPGAIGYVSDDVELAGVKTVRIQD